MRFFSFFPRMLSSYAFSQISIAVAIILAAGCSNEAGHKAQHSNVPYLDEKAAIHGRAFIALPLDNKQVFLSWRLLPGDSPDVVFRVYRVAQENGAAQLVGQTANTSLIDRPAFIGSVRQYKLCSVDKGTEATIAEGKILQNAEAAAGEYCSLYFDLGENYKQARIAIGDLDGDGDMEFVIQYANSKNLDPAMRVLKIGQSEDTIKVAAFRKTGELLWKKDLGRGIEAGFVYSPMVVWDIDNDGRAEVILKTNNSNNPLDYSNEKLTVLEGISGKMLRETNWPSPTGLGGWEETGDGLGETYNSVSRNLLAIAHLDGRNASIIAVRGVYLAQKIVSYDKDLEVQWERFNGLNIYNPLKRIWQLDHKIERLKARLNKDTCRGAHILPVADIDGDGKEKILWGETCIGDGGRVIWRIKERMPYVGHPDIVFPADIIPDNEGMEIFYCREGEGKPSDNIGMAVFDRQGKPLWGKWGYHHVDGGWVAKVIPESKGLQCFGYDLEQKIWEKEKVTRQNVTGYLWGSDGTLIKKVDEAWVDSFPVDWDGDGISKICLTDGSIVDHNRNVIAKVKGKPLWAADIYGDHREEIAAIVEGTKLFLYFNPNQLKAGAKVARITDRKYRNNISKSVRY